MRIERLDDRGDRVPLTQPVRRVVSLSPSLTEVVQSIDPALLIGVTTDAGESLPVDVARLGSALAPDVRTVSRLVPDVVLACRSDNRPEDVQRLRDAGLGVWVCEVETVAQAFHSVDRLVVDALGHSRPGWLSVAEKRWNALSRRSRLRAVVVDSDSSGVGEQLRVLGSNHLVTDLLAHHGVENVMASHRDRFPMMTGPEIATHHVDVVIALVDGSRTDHPGPGQLGTHVDGIAVRALDRRTLTHFGPTLLDAATLLEEAFPRTSPNR